MTTKVSMWGNSLGYRFPKELADKLGIKDGTEVESIEKSGGLFIQPKKQSSLSPQTKKSTVTPPETLSKDMNGNKLEMTSDTVVPPSKKLSQKKGGKFIVPLPMSTPKCDKLLGSHPKKPHSTPKPPPKTNFF